MSKKLSPLWRTWYSWKSLRMPWRKQFLAGHDLEGNTYWEFYDVRNAGTGAPAPRGGGSGGPDAAGAPAQRMRRIVKYPRGTHPGVVRVPPQWHQWLRHVRADAPTLAEQQQDMARQQRMRVLAAQADARWADAKRVEEGRGTVSMGIMDQPATAAIEGLASTVEAQQGDAVAGREHPELEQEPQPEAVTIRARSQPAVQPQQQPPLPSAPDDPWKREEPVRGAPGEKWQPAAWAPPPKQR